MEGPAEVRIMYYMQILLSSKTCMKHSAYNFSSDVDWWGCFYVGRHTEELNWVGTQGTETLDDARKGSYCKISF